ncbi:hypothetical protein chiPu_0005477 [Chiloscyllium punctatum]|uniref:Uncharacterized protein n=1 Tax=Chiloscyllium punctatum TaxID=137246 RepID=A0A401S9L1_CHIPU|nr:hypothetical protein [Chiloscyllium punctatum]
MNDLTLSPSVRWCLNPRMRITGDPARKARAFWFLHLLLLEAKGGRIQQSQTKGRVVLARIIPSLFL